ncbi:helix-turn-helix domain-containing protein [Fodinicola acaciae]|uniref:helix-turn-helix domain-containing protein n=1 Tax=Fodinicola acaciae TaxID=2681555 RepID=UPI0013D768D3|nr:helix-turn-helix transcriptional regulator [Fodinicola acaciae]
MATTAGPRFSRRRVGEEIRRLRLKADLSQGELGKKVRASGARISRLETGETQPDLALVMNILETLEVEEELSRTLILIAREANEQMWWKTSGLPERQRAYAELEGTSSSCREFSWVVVPGLLQSPGYIKVRYSDRESSLPLDIAAASAGRQERQKILTRSQNPLKFTVVLDEGVILRRAAPDEVMREQRRHLLEMTALSNVDIRVLEIDAKVSNYGPPLNSFSIYAVRTGSVVTYVETESDEVQVTNPLRVGRYEALFKRLLEAALSPEKSRAFIERAGI